MDKDKSSNSKSYKGLLIAIDLTSLDIVIACILMDTLWSNTNLNIIESFIRQYPENNDVNIVAVKVALIDSTNSTHFSTQQRSGATLKEFAQNIIDCDFDNRIKKLDPDLVKEIALGTGGGKERWERNFFSLATKYCHYHNRFVPDIPDEYRYEYPIFDSNVCKKISDYSNELTRGKLETIRKHADYEKFNQIIEDILNSRGITKEEMPERIVAFDCLLYGVRDIH